MPMSPFNDRFPDAQILVLHSQQEGMPLPPGEYGFFEMYCDEDGCDCRRVVLQAQSPQFPGEILAVINFGWESEKFYNEKMPYLDNPGREITSGSLDPLNPQSKLADAVLDGFRRFVRANPDYVQQLKRHYEMFKGRRI